jgi:hypothetical protein
MRNYIDEKLNSRTSLNKEDDNSPNEELYPGSSIKISKFMHSSILKEAESFTAYVHKIFTSIFSVEDCINKNLRGGSSKNGQGGGNKLEPFSIDLLNHLYKAVEHHYSKDVHYLRKKYMKTSRNPTENKFIKKEIYASINRVVTNKLGKINRHFQNLINGVVDNNITKNERLLFANYNKYSENVNLIKKLFENNDQNKRDKDSENATGLDGDTNGIGLDDDTNGICLDGDTNGIGLDGDTNGIGLDGDANYIPPSDDDSWSNDSELDDLNFNYYDNKPRHKNKASKKKYSYTSSSSEESDDSTKKKRVKK